MSGRRTVSRVLQQLVLAAFVAVAPAAVAQDAYPSRTIKMIVPVTPGGGPDVLARILAEKLAAKWGQPVIVENRPGGALNIGAEAVANAEPDGYTLLVTPPGPLVTSQSLYPTLKFDPSAFVPVSIIAKAPFVLVAGPKTQFSTLQELVNFAKANPDKLNFPSPGVGSPPHLVGEMFNARAGVRLVHVAYKGLMPALTDVLGGHIDVMFHDLGSTLSHVKAGKLRMLAVASEGRLPELPDVPAISELLPRFVATTWYAVVAPPKTSPAIAAKLSQAIAEALRLPDVAKRIADFSATPVGSSPAETAAFLKQETERWRQVIATAGIKPE